MELSAHDLEAIGLILDSHDPTDFSEEQVHLKIANFRHKHNLGKILSFLSFIFFPFLPATPSAFPRHGTWIAKPDPRPRI